MWNGIALRDFEPVTHARTHGIRNVYDQNFEVLETDHEPVDQSPRVPPTDRFPAVQSIAT